MSSLSRRSVLQLGGGGVLINLSGCFGLFKDRSFKVFVRNELSEQHTIWVKFIVNSQDVDGFEKTFHLDPQKQWNHQMRYPEGGSAAEVVSQVDDKPKLSEEFRIKDNLESFGVIARKADGELIIHHRSHWSPGET